MLAISVDKQARRVSGCVNEGPPNKTDYFDRIVSLVFYFKIKEYRYNALF
jgi:hypothetical protein